MAFFHIRNGVGFCWTSKMKEKKNSLFLSFWSLTFSFGVTVLFHYTEKRQAKYLILCSIEEKKRHAGLNDMILNNWTFCHHLLTNDEINFINYLIWTNVTILFCFLDVSVSLIPCLFLSFSLRISETGSSRVTFSGEVTANRHVTVINTSVMHFPHFSFFEGSLFLFPSAEISSSLRHNTNNEAFNL